MRRTVLSIWVLSALVLSSGGVRANSNTSIPSKSLAELIRMALDRNPALRAQEKNTEAQVELVSPAGALPDPMLSVEAMNYPVDSLKAGESGMTGVQVSVRQGIPFPGKRGQQEAAARASSRAEKRRFEQQRLELVREVTASYYELYLAVQNRRLLEDQRTFIRQLTSASRSQFALGRIPQAALLNLQVEEANLIDETLRADAVLTAKRTRLAELVASDDDPNRLEPEKPPRAAIDTATLDEKRLLEKAVQQNPELLALQAQVESQEAQAALARRNLLPDFEIMAGYTFREPSMEDRDGRDFVSAGVGLTLPLWAGGKQLDERRAAQAQRSAAMAQFESGRREVERAVRTRVADLRESLRRVELFEGGLVQLTQQAAASAKSAYLTGRMSYGDVLEAIRAQFRTAYALEEAQVQVQINLAALESLVGSSLGEGL